MPPRLHRVEVLSFPLQDMAPYVPKLMPKLKDALVDPLPEVRATAAKALGSLLKGMGEEYLQDILPYLMQKLKAEVGGGGNASLSVAGSIGTLTAAPALVAGAGSVPCRLHLSQGAAFCTAVRHGTRVGCCSLQGSGVERSGAAQGLAEVLAVLGPRQVEALLPDIMANTKNKSPFVREGHLNLFKFLPLVMPEQFQVRGLLQVCRH